MSFLRSYDGRISYLGHAVGHRNELGPDLQGNSLVGRPRRVRMCKIIVAVLRG